MNVLIPVSKKEDADPNSRYDLRLLTDADHLTPSDRVSLELGLTSDLSVPAPGFRGLKSMML